MATGATEFIDSTTHDVFIPERWSGPAIVAREAALIMARGVDLRYTPALSGGGDIVNIGSVGNLTAQTKVKASNAATSYETITETNVQITVATWGYSAVAVESIVDVQSYEKAAKQYAPKQGFALALQSDDTLAGHPDDFTNATGSLAATSPYSDYLRAVQYLDDANAPQEDRWFGVAPAEVAGLLQMKEYVHNDYSMLHGSGPAMTSRERAYVTSFLTIPVYKSTNVEGTNAAGHDNFLMHREAIAFILQQEPTMWGPFRDVDYFATKIAFEQIYGSAITRNDHGVFMRGA